MLSDPVGLRPFAASFVELANATESLHLWDKGLLGDLHDVWQFGAPDPANRVELRRYDERLEQRGMNIRRFVYPAPFVAWIMHTAEKRGILLTRDTARLIASGQYRPDGQE